MMPFSSRSIGCQRFLHKQQYASISTESARKILGLSLSPSSSSSAISMKELRVAYFKASKACHPDTQFGKNTYQDATLQFLAVTEAYEQLKHLTTSTTNTITSEVIISKTEEEEFREACQEWLGISAEIVEESKQCPIFREWLKGKVRSDCTIFFPKFYKCLFLILTKNFV